MRTGVAFAPVLGLLLISAACTSPVSDAELAARVKASRPEWQSYQEDIKAQLGAGPVAEWRGEPVRAVQEGSALRLTFQLTGPWSRRDCFAPILVADPRGVIQRPVSAMSREREVIYGFDLGEGGGAVPWLEVKFPNGEKRLVFDQNGVWPPS